MSDYISVKDKLPDDDTRVIAKYDGVYSGRGEVFNRGVLFWLDECGNPHFGGFAEIDGKGSQPATHWKPLEGQKMAGYDLCPDVISLAVQVTALQAERDKLKIANDYHKAQHGHYALEANQVREERDKLKKAVLLWYNGSPEDAECDQQLCEIAALLGDKP